MRIQAMSVALVLLLGAGTVVVAGCEEKITQEKLVQVLPGMTLDQVEKVLGGKGTRQEVSGMSISGAGIGGTNTSSQEIYVWKENRKEISVTMGGGKVVSVNRAGF